MSVITVSLSGLDEAHATVTSATAGFVSVAIMAPSGSITLHGGRDVVRQLLTDAVAQLDAIAAQYPEEPEG